MEFFLLLRLCLLANLDGFFVALRCVMEERVAFVVCIVEADVRRQRN